MKCSIKYSKILMIAAFMVLLFGCSKNKFLDVNTNPNYPVNLSAAYVLPSAEANIGYMVSNTLSIYGGLYAEYWTADPNAAQYDFFDAYIVRPTDDDRLWADLYAVGTNLNYIIADTITADRNYVAIAYILKAYTFQLLTDAFGNIPLTQSLQGTAHLNPKYDSSLIVYDSLPVWVNKGLALIATTTTHTVAYNPNSPSTDLIYPGASMIEWQQFANTLLLKIYLRECRKNPSAASAGITALMATSPVFLSAHSDDAMILYNNQLYQQYPYYETNISLGGYRSMCASSTCINYMDSLNDPRLADFYTATPGGLFTGALQGNFTSAAGTPDSTFCAMGTEVYAPTASTRFITASESYFLQAEAMARGYMPGSASTAYNSGISTSWASWSNSQAAAATQLSTYMAQTKVAYPTGGSVQQQVMAIITQKWISMCGNQNFEAWTEWRRIGIPLTSPQFVLSVGQQDNGLFPRRLIYANAEEEDNTNFPGVQPISAPVWWDTNN